MDREKVIEAFDEAKELVWTDDDEYTVGYNNGLEAGKNIALALLKEQGWNLLTEDNDGIIHGFPGDDGQYLMTDGTDIWIDDYVDGVDDGIILDSGRDILKQDALELLKKQEAKPPIHVHEEYPEHDWERKENGDIDNFAYEGGYHNGPSCKRCYYSFCIHCDPDGWNKEPCIIDEYKCPKCGRYIGKGTKFCSDCGQAVKWE